MGIHTTIDTQKTSTGNSPNPSRGVKDQTTQENNTFPNLKRFTKKRYIPLLLHKKQEIEQLYYVV